MNSRTAVGHKALLLKEDHGFALGVREMKIFSLSPRNYVTLRRKSDMELTPDIILGQAFHKLLLQGRKGFKVHSRPHEICRHKPLAHFSHNEGSHITHVDMWRLEHMLHNFYHNPEVRRLLFDAQVYKVCSGLFIERFTGCECFFNADFILPGKGCVIDVKTCRDASPEAVDAEIDRFKYHWQAWWAKTGAGLSFEMPVNDFVFVFVAQNPPFNVTVRYASAGMLNRAREEVLPFIDMYGDYFETGRFGRRGN